MIPKDSSFFPSHNVFFPFIKKKYCFGKILAFLIKIINKFVWKVVAKVSTVCMYVCMYVCMQVGPILLRPFEIRAINLCDLFFIYLIFGYIIFFLMIFQNPIRP